MKKKYIHILIFLCLTAIVSQNKISAQKEAGRDNIIIESLVLNEEGKPVAGATVLGNEGAAIAKTDLSGRFAISVPRQTDLLIEAAGYESTVFRPGEYTNLNSLLLKSSSFMYSDIDDVNIAFGIVKRGNLANAVSVLTPANIIKYDNIQGISEVLNGGVPGMLGGSNIRGIGNALVLVDGLPRSAANINLSEVEQITVLKDINSAVLYGSDAVNGVLMITTKRGQAHKKRIDVSGYYGISTPTALPKYLGSADYMELYNEAKVNDGLSPQFDAATIENYRTGDQYRYPSIDYYSGEYLKNFRPFSRVMSELSGGNDVATYYSNIGWEQWGSLLDFGEGKSAGTNKFNIRGNVDMRINSWIKSSVDAGAILTNAKGPVGNYWSETATLKPHLFAPLLPISIIDPEDPLLKGRKNDVNGMYLLGGTSSYPTNPIANGYSGGTTENVQRNFSFDNRVDFDLNNFVEGLAFHTNISFDLYATYNQSITNQYSVYDPFWGTTDSINSLTKYGTDVRTGSQNVGSFYFTRSFSFYGMLDYNRNFNGVHQVSGSLLGYGNKYKERGIFFGSSDVHLGLRLAYGYRNKYLADFSSAYVSSVKLPEGNRGALSPTLGMAWVISSEDFIKSIPSINYLKLRLSGGIINSDSGIDGFYLYDNKYGSSGSYAWYEGTWSGSGTVSVSGVNSLLAFEKRKELNFGFEGVFFNHLLSVNANVFTSEYYDQITTPQTQYPSFFTNFIPYRNFDSNSYRGAELGVSFNREIGDFKFVLGANALYTTSEVKKRDEIYANDYQYRAGHPVDARFGLVADGFFIDQADINDHGIQAFGTVKPGDIKYVDQNGDGIIDSNDEIVIGRWQAPFSYGVNFQLSYKNLTLVARGNGRIGADGYITGDYYWVDGNDKYSEYILNRWTETTIATATLPRLSSQANNNNYRSSTFWLYKDDYFTLDRVQLTYEMPERIAGMLRMRQLNVFVNASNLFTVSRYKDIRELRIGAEPYYRSFSMGVKTMF